MRNGFEDMKTTVTHFSEHWLLRANIAPFNSASFKQKNEVMRSIEGVKGVKFSLSQRPLINWALLKQYPFLHYPASLFIFFALLSLLHFHHPISIIHPTEITIHSFIKEKQDCKKQQRFFQQFNQAHQISSGFCCSKFNYFSFRHWLLNSAMSLS